VPVVNAERAVLPTRQRTTSGAANRPTAVGGSASRVSRRTAVLRVRRDLPTPGEPAPRIWSHWIRWQGVDGSGTRLPTDRGRATTTRKPGDLSSVAGPGVPAGQWSIERAWPRQRQVIHVATHVPTPFRTVALDRIAMTCSSTVEAQRQAIRRCVRGRISHGDPDGGAHLRVVLRANALERRQQLTSARTG
jgi:hypothetical protein